MGRGVWVDVSVGTGVSVGAGVTVDVEEGMAVKVSVGSSLVEVETGCGDVSREAGVGPPVLALQADGITIKIMKGKNKLGFMC